MICISLWQVVFLNAIITHKYIFFFSQWKQMKIFLKEHPMTDPNVSTFHPSSFILGGVPGLQSGHSWVALPICLMYATAFLGNCAILFSVKTDSSLHEPMFILLCMLALIDLVLSSCIMPKMISLFLINSREIAFSACLTQMFFIHALSAMESTILLAMSFDRYVAICHPLRHEYLHSNRFLVTVAIVAVTRSLILFTPLPFLLQRLSYCRSNILSHTYCLHQDIMKLSCTNAKVNFVYGLLIVLAVMGLDCLLILISYVLILRTVVHLSSRASRVKAFHTCASHLSAVLMFYLPLIGLSVVHRYGKNTSSIATWMAHVYLLVPPVLNPLVYGIKTKQIRQKILAVFHHNTIHVEHFT
ncbi:olfactory receptor 51E2-like [Lissotriton helveticus]